MSTTELQGWSSWAAAWSSTTSATPTWWGTAPTSVSSSTLPASLMALIQGQGEIANVFTNRTKNKPNFCFLGPMRRSPGERSERTQHLWRCMPRSASFSLLLWLRLLQRGIIRNKLKVFSHPHTLGHNYEAPSYQESLYFGKSFGQPFKATDGWRPEKWYFVK